MPLIRNGRPAEDRFAFLGDTELLDEGEGPMLVPLARWRAEREALIASGRELGVLLQPDESVRALSDDLDNFSLVAFEVPVFKDGRIFSAARLLRERFGFQGDIRAFGQVLPDQALFLARCGVNEIGFAEDARSGAFEAAFRELTVAFQPARASVLAPLRMRPTAGAFAHAAE